MPKMTAHQEVKVVSQHVPDAWPSAAIDYGTGIDAASFEEALIVVHSGTNTATGTVDVLVQDSADNSTYAAVTGASFTQITTANDNTVYVGRINLRAVNRYIRVGLNVSTDAADVGTEVILLAGASLPVSQTETVAFNITAQ